MRLYEEYIKEREGLSLVSDEHCFITFKLDNEEVIVYDIYSDKKVRGTGHMLSFCKDFFTKMSKEGISSAYGFTDEKTNGWKHSDQLLKKYGFKFIGKDPENNHINNYHIELKVGE